MSALKITFLLYGLSVAIDSSIDEAKNSWLPSKENKINELTFAKKVVNIIGFTLNTIFILTETKAFTDFSLFYSLIAIFFYFKFKISFKRNIPKEIAK